jgi:cytochrome c oxidase subunit IV
MHPVTPVRTYVIIWAILTIMTFTTYGIAQIDLGPFNTVVALMIAFFKMSLVVLFFMNVRQEKPLTKIFVVAGFFWLLILLFMTMGDYISRSWLPPGKMW